ncbi:MAG: hypothetical protein F6J93_17160 [Oscillatoria sp. SIO1A7]|nr:hypothetical protein [Oscillatoria sp. SIO1A7]
MGCGVWGVGCGVWGVGCRELGRAELGRAELGIGKSGIGNWEERNWELKRVLRFRFSIKDWQLSCLQTLKLRSQNSQAKKSKLSS